MSNQETINEVSVQLSKAAAELVAKVSSLESAAAEAGVALDFTELKAVAQSLDDIVPDATAEGVPAEVPAEVPAAEDAVEALSEVPAEVPAE